LTRHASSGAGFEGTVPTEQSIAGTPSAGRAAARSRPRCPIPFGMAALSGRMCEPREVPLGKGCGCICPACRVPLVAKHCTSGRRAPHFAHAHGADCAGAVETALHLAAKQRIAERGALWFPALGVRLKARDARGLTHVVSKKLSPAGLRPLSDVVMEASVATIRPDLVAHCAHFGAVSIEIAVTHFVDRLKLDKIAAAGLAALEVDLSHLRSVDFNQLDAILFAPNACTRWLHHARLLQCEDQLRGDLCAHLEQVNADARAALHAAQSFAGSGLAQRAESARQDPHWVRELESKARAAQRARDFRYKPEDEKRTALCRWLRATDLPAFLTARCRQPGAFGVSDAAIWQSALFIGQIDGMPRRGNRFFNAEDARHWLSERFRIAAGHEHAAREAFDTYVASLRAFGVLGPPVNGDYPILVVDTSAFAASIVASQPGADIDNELCWVDGAHWPSGLEAKTIVEAMQLPIGFDQRRRLSRLNRAIAASPPSYFCETFASSFRIEIDRLVDYLARAGYLCVG
jgi:hypothetical protein